MEVRVSVDPLNKGKFMTKIFLADNVEWSSKNLWKMMSADLKTSIIQQEIKGLVAHLTNFIHELYLKSNANSGCICHLILVCILSILILSVKNREGGWFLLNGKNRLSIFVDIQSLSCIVPRPSALLGYIPTRIYRK